jgi:FkbM family methyltransferase
LSPAAIAAGRAPPYARGQRVVRRAREAAMRIPSEWFSDRSLFERRAAEQARSAYLGGRTALCRVLGSLLLYVDTDDTGISPHLIMSGYWESWVSCAIGRVLRPGWHCVDIGANHGYYTLLLAEAAGPAGRTLAVEPNPRLAGLLGRSLLVNGLAERATVVQAAALDLDGTAARLSYPAHLINATLDRPAAGDDRTIEAATVTLDTLTRDWQRVDLVKVDAEGAEEAIWHGGRLTWERHRDVIVVLEFNAARYADPAAFLDAITATGFRLGLIRWDGAIELVTAAAVLASPSDLMLWLAR